MKSQTLYKPILECAKFYEDQIFICYTKTQGYFCSKFNATNCTKSFVLLPSLVHFYHLRDFANFKIIYEFDAKHIELLAVDIKKELTKDLLI